jgi:hypothetical protein
MNENNEITQQLTTQHSPAHWSKLLLVSVFAFVFLGCTMSLEAARNQGVQKHAASLKTTPSASQSSDRTECRNIDGIRKTWGYVEISVTPVAPLALGIAAIPGVEGKAQNALFIGGGVAAVAAGFAAGEKHVWTNQWTEMCSASGAQ